MTALPGYPCPICRKPARDVGLNRAGESYVQLCSDACLQLYIRRGFTDMTDASEKASAIKGGEAGGAYLDQIGKSDLGNMTRAEWEEFCTRLFQGACEHMRVIASDEIPF